MTTRFVCAALVAWLMLLSAAGAAEPKAYPFFPFCIDWHDAKKRSFEQQAEMLKSLGYDGVGHIGLDKVAERLRTLQGTGLKTSRRASRRTIPGSRTFWRWSRAATCSSRCWSVA
jgi:hypothetical protein